MMKEISTFAVGIIFLVLGIPIGNFLAKSTKEELKSRKKWFRLIIGLSFIGAIIFIILGNDVLLFTFLFIAIVTGRSLKR
jgi:hypothetical protein